MSRLMILTVHERTSMSKSAQFDHSQRRTICGKMRKEQTPWSIRQQTIQREMRRLNSRQ